MGENVFDIDRLLDIFDFNYQSVIVTFDVENRACTYQISRGEVALHLRRVSPNNSLANSMPNH
jgi:hypothetical protein